MEKRLGKCCSKIKDKSLQELPISVFKNAQILSKSPTKTLKTENSWKKKLFKS